MDHECQPDAITLENEAMSAMSNVGALTTMATMIDSALTAGFMISNAISNAIVEQPLAGA